METVQFHDEKQAENAEKEDWNWFENKEIDDADDEEGSEDESPNTKYALKKAKNLTNRIKLPEIIQPSANEFIKKNISYNNVVLLDLNL